MSWSKGTSRKPHTPACRERFAKLLEDQAKFKNSQQRMREFKVKEMEKLKGLKRLREDEPNEDEAVKKKVVVEDEGGANEIK